MDLKSELIKIGEQVEELRPHLRTILDALPSTKVASNRKKFLGMDARSVQTRIEGFWPDLAALTKEYWGFNLQSVDLSHHKVLAKVRGFGGNEYTIAVDGVKANQIRCTVYLHDPESGRNLDVTSTRFDWSADMKEIIEWTDTSGIKLARMNDLDPRQP